MSDKSSDKTDQMLMSNSRSSDSQSCTTTADLLTPNWLESTVKLLTRVRYRIT